MLLVGPLGKTRVFLFSSFQGSGGCTPVLADEDYIERGRDVKEQGKEFLTFMTMKYNYTRAGLMVISLGRKLQLGLLQNVP